MNKIVYLLFLLSFSCSRETSKEYKSVVSDKPNLEYKKSVEKPPIEPPQPLPSNAREFADKLSAISAEISSGKVSKERLADDLKLYFNKADPNLRSTYQLLLTNYFRDIRYYDVSSNFVIYKEILNYFPADYSASLLDVIITDCKEKYFVSLFTTVGAPALADVLVRSFSIDDSFAVLALNKPLPDNEYQAMMRSTLYWSWFEKDFKLAQNYFIKDKLTHGNGSVMFEVGKYYGIKAHQEGVDIFVPLALQTKQERSILCFVNCWVSYDHIKAISWVDSYPKGNLRDEMIVELNRVLRYVRTNNPELYTNLKIELNAHSFIQ